MVDLDGGIGFTGTGPWDSIQLKTLLSLSSSAGLIELSMK